MNNNDGRLKKSDSHQTETSQRKNSEFFLDEYEMYRRQVGSIDTYASISAAINKEISGISSILDIGNGGVFDYDASLVANITGLDLFLDALPKNIVLPSNVKMVQGSALSIPELGKDFDGVVMVMLLHHLVGSTVEECIANVRKAIEEAYRVLRPGGKFILAESCVPKWFFGFEKIVFRPSSWIIERTIKHPPTLQFTDTHIAAAMSAAGFHEVYVARIPKGKFVLQYGVKIPSFATPVQPTIFTGIK